MIFISYSRVDKATAELIMYFLLQQGYLEEQIFIDTISMTIGEEWPERLAKAIDDCDDFLYLLSPDSAKSQWCKEEFQRAKGKNKNICILMVREVEEMPFGLSRVHSSILYDGYVKFKLEDLVKRGLKTKPTNSPITTEKKSEHKYDIDRQALSTILKSFVKVQKQKSRSFDVPTFITLLQILSSSDVGELISSDDLDYLVNLLQT